MADIESLVQAYAWSDEESRIIAEGIIHNLRGTPHADLIPAWEDVLILIRIAREGERVAVVTSAPATTPRNLSTLIDQKVGLLSRRLASEAELGALSDWSAQAGELRLAAWPKGLAPFTRAPFVDKSAQLVDLIELLQAPTWGPVLNALRLSPVVANLAALSPEFDHALTAPAPEPAASATPARRAANEALRRQVCRIIGLFDTSDTTQVKERDRILEPLARINTRLHERWSAAWAARRKKMAEEECKKGEANNAGNATAAK
jgi:hypothetical protein